MLNALGLAEVVVNELLELSVQLRDRDIERDILFVEVAVGQIEQVSLPLRLELVTDTVEFTPNCDGLPQ